MKAFSTGPGAGREANNVARTRAWVLCTVIGTVALTPLLAQDGYPSPADWPMFGQNPANTASNAAATGISAANAPNLKTRWTFTTGGDVSARAAVVNGVAYFPDWGGNLWAVNTGTGKAIWSHQFSDYGLAAGTVSRTSPAVANGLVYVGTQYVAPASPSAPQPPTGWLLAINATTGALVWKVQPDTSNPFPVITGSPVVASGIVYVPMTSNEEFAAAAGPAYYNCCSVSGSVVALNALSGSKIWETFSVPSGYSGGAVWGSNPVVDVARGKVFVGTGNNYSVPTDPNYLNCITGGGSRATCQSPNDHADSILALDMFTGSVKWATRLETWNQLLTEGVANGSDDWNVDCIFAAAGTANCPSFPGPDYDFGSAPNEITYQTSNGPKTIIGAGQKSGIYYALDPDTGNLLWQTQVGPGSSLGGIEWGSATDGTRIYVAIADLYGVPYTFPTGGSSSAGSWAALDPATGNIVWQKADPNGAIDLGPMAAVNGVVYADSMALSATAPTMFALDATNGATLWSFAAGSSVNAGAAIVDDTVYWGSGYTHLGAALGSGNTQFYAFSVNANAGGLNGSNCDGVYTGTYKGNLTVSQGQSCVFTKGGITGNLTQNGGTVVLGSNSLVNGNLQMNGGSLSIGSSTVGGNLQITGGVTFLIGPGVTIGGNLQIQNLPAGAGTNQVCGTSIKGNLQFQNSGAAALIGSSGSGCAGNTVGGNLQVENNTAATTIDSNTVQGNLSDQNNTAATQVFTNTVKGNLQCNGDSSITGGGNTAASKQGQCAAF